MRDAESRAHGAAVATLQYPATTRGDVADDYHGVRVADPYRWFEDPAAQATRDWVTAENALAQPYLEHLPQRAWLGDRLKQLWTYERFGVPRREGGHYFYMRNDGTQDQSVLYVADSLDRDGASAGRSQRQSRRRDDRAVAMGAEPQRRDPRVCAFRWRHRLEHLAFPSRRRWRRPAGRAQVQQVLAGLLGARQLRRVLQPLSAQENQAADDSRGDDSGRPDVFFHKLDRCAVGGSTRLPGDGSPDACALGAGHRRRPLSLIGLFDGYETNGWLVQDLRKPGAKPQPLFTDWDALYNLLGSNGDELYFQTTKDAPRGRVIAVDARDPAPAKWRTVVPQGDYSINNATYVGGRVVVEYTRDARSLVRLFEASGSRRAKCSFPVLAPPPDSRAAAPNPETFFSYSDYLSPTRVLRLDVAEECRERIPHAESARGFLARS